MIDLDELERRAKAGQAFHPLTVIALIDKVKEAAERADQLMAACHLAILALAHAAEKDARYQLAYEALDAVMVPGREA